MYNPLRILDDKVIGRELITTSYLDASMVKGEDVASEYILTSENIADVLNDCLTVHFHNASRIRYLMDFYKGKQDILNRVKDIRKNIDNKVVLNFALSTTRNIIGYTFNKPVKYVAKRKELEDEIEELNEDMELVFKGSIDQEKGEDASICGTSYVICVPSSSKIGADEDVPFSLTKLNPETTFVAYHSSDSKVPVLACTYHTDYTINKMGTVTFYVYTPYTIYIFKTENGVGSIMNISANNLIDVRPNILGTIPIIEYPNNQYRIGDWEGAVSIFNAINNATSDNVNDVEQFVNSILVLLGTELPTIEALDPTTNESVEMVDTDAIREGILQLPPAENGTNIDAKYITNQLDSSSIEKLMAILEKAYHVVCGVPDRKTNGSAGGDTGDAVSKRDGWQEIETIALIKERKYSESEMRLLKLILKIKSISKRVNTPKITVRDIQIKFSRNKTDNITTKANAISTLNSTMLFDPVDILTWAEITTDEASVIERGKIYREENQPEPTEVIDVNETKTSETDNKDNKEKTKEETKVTQK